MTFEPGSYYARNGEIVVITKSLLNCSLLIGKVKIGTIEITTIWSGKTGDHMGDSRWDLLRLISPVTPKDTSREGRPKDLLIRAQQQLVHFAALAQQGKFLNEEEIKVLDKLIDEVKTLLLEG